jgi:hypothetical protein
MRNRVVKKIESKVLYAGRLWVDRRRIMPLTRIEIDSHNYRAKLIYLIQNKPTIGQWANEFRDEKEKLEAFRGEFRVFYPTTSLQGVHCDHSLVNVITTFEVLLNLIVGSMDIVAGMVLNMHAGNDNKEWYQNQVDLLVAKYVHMQTWSGGFKEKFDEFRRDIKAMESTEEYKKNERRKIQEHWKTIPSIAWKTPKGMIRDITRHEKILSKMSNQLATVKELGYPFFFDTKSVLAKIGIALPKYIEKKMTEFKIDFKGTPVQWVLPEEWNEHNMKRLFEKQTKKITQQEIEEMDKQLHRALGMPVPSKPEGVVAIVGGFNPKKGLPTRLNKLCADAKDQLLPGQYVLLYNEAEQAKRDEYSSEKNEEVAFEAALNLARTLYTTKYGSEHAAMFLAKWDIHGSATVAEVGPAGAAAAAVAMEVDPGGAAAAAKDDDMDVDPMLLYVEGAVGDGVDPDFFTADDGSITFGNYQPQ